MFPVIKIAIFSEISDYRYSIIFKKSLLKKKKKTTACQICCSIYFKSDRIVDNYVIAV